MNNLTIKSKLALLVAIPLLILIALGANLTFKSYNKSNLKLKIIL